MHIDLYIISLCSLKLNLFSWRYATVAYRNYSVHTSNSHMYGEKVLDTVKKYVAIGS